jgi:TctA family transporter
MRLWIVLSLAWIGLLVAVIGTDEFKGLYRLNVQIEVEYKGEVRDVYSITSLARASRVSGSARPSALAVLRLTRSS